MTILDWILNRDQEDGENWVEERYQELESTVEEIEEEIGIEEIKRFTEQTVEPGDPERKNSRGEYFRSNKSGRNGPFVTGTDTEELNRYAEAGLLDTGDFNGFFDLYTLTELGEEMLDKDRVEEIEDAEELLEEDLDKAAGIPSADGRELEEDTGRRPVTSGEQDEDLVVKQMQDNGASKPVLTPSGQEYRRRMEDVDLGELRNITEYDRSYEPTAEDRLRVLKEGLPRLDEDERNREVSESIQQMRSRLEQYGDIEPSGNGDFSEFDRLVGEALHALEHYTELTDETGKEEEKFIETVRHKVKGLKSFYSAAGGLYDLSNNVDTKERNRESIYSTYQEIIPIYSRIEELMEEK